MQFECCILCVQCMYHAVITANCPVQVDRVHHTQTSWSHWQVCNKLHDMSEPTSLTGYVNNVSTVVPHASTNHSCEKWYELNMMAHMCNWYCNVQTNTPCLNGNRLQLASNNTHGPSYNHSLVNCVVSTLQAWNVKQLTRALIQLHVFS